MWKADLVKSNSSEGGRGANLVKGPGGPDLVKFKGSGGGGQEPRASFSSSGPLRPQPPAKASNIRDSKL